MEFAATNTGRGIRQLQLRVVGDRHYSKPQCVCVRGKWALDPKFLEGVSVPRGDWSGSIFEGSLTAGRHFPLLAKLTPASAAKLFRKSAAQGYPQKLCITLWTDSVRAVSSQACGRKFVGLISFSPRSPP